MKFKSELDLCLLNCNNRSYSPELIYGTHAYGSYLKRFASRRLDVSVIQHSNLYLLLFPNVIDAHKTLTFMNQLR